MMCMLIVDPTVEIYSLIPLCLPQFNEASHLIATRGFSRKKHQTNQKHQKLGNGSQVAQHMDLGQPWLDTLVL